MEHQTRTLVPDRAFTDKDLFHKHTFDRGVRNPLEPNRAFRPFGHRADSFNLNHRVTVGDLIAVIGRLPEHDGLPAVNAHNRLHTALTAESPNFTAQRVDAQLLRDQQNVHHLFRGEGRFVAADLKAGRLHGVPQLVGVDFQLFSHTGDQTCVGTADGGSVVCVVAHDCVPLKRKSGNTIRPLTGSVVSRKG